WPSSAPRTAPRRWCCRCVTGWWRRRPEAAPRPVRVLTRDSIGRMQRDACCQGRPTARHGQWDVRGRDGSCPEKATTGRGVAARQRRVRQPGVAAAGSARTHARWGAGVAPVATANAGEERAGEKKKGAHALLLLRATTG